MSINEIIEVINEGLKMPFAFFFSPRKRIYFLYLITTTVLAYWVFARTVKNEKFLNYIFKKKVWLSKSAFVDYGFAFFNSFVKILLIAPILAYGIYIALSTNIFLENSLGVLQTPLSKTQTIILYTVALTLVGDFASFIVHYAFHKIPFLWEFHKVHHSATVLNPITQFRIHPIELIINNIKTLIVNAPITGLFMYLSQGQAELITFLGLNVFGFIFMFLGANLRHSHVKLKFNKYLEYIFISPVQHQVHHSDKPEHYDKNLGSKLAIWDYFFGTLIR